MPAGLDTSNGSLLFTRPLELSDSGQYRCGVKNDVGQNFKDVRFLVQGEKFLVTFQVHRYQ